MSQTAVTPSPLESHPKRARTELESSASSGVGLPMFKKTEEHRIIRRELIHYMVRWSHEFPNWTVTEDYLTPDCPYHCPMGDRAVTGPVETRQLLNELIVQNFISVSMYAPGRVIVDDGCAAVRRVIAGVMTTGKPAALPGMLFVTFDKSNRINGWYDIWNPAVLQGALAGQRVEELMGQLELRNPAKNLVSRFLDSSYGDLSFWRDLLVDDCLFGFPASSAEPGKDKALNLLNGLRDRVNGMMPVLDSPIMWNKNHCAFECSLIVISKSNYKFHMAGAVIIEATDESFSQVRSWRHVFSRALMDRFL